MGFSIQKKHIQSIAAMESPETKLPLKVMIDSKRNKVLFAEAGSDFVDVLLSFLTLPLGTIIRRLNQHFGGKTDALRCINNLYSSVENLSDSDFVLKEDRHMLLHPKNASRTVWLKLNVDDSKRTPYYECPLRTCPEITIDYNAECSCGRPMTNLKYVFRSQNGRVFTNSKKSFIITDDLRLMPDGSYLELLQDLASNVYEFEEKTISVGLNEIMHLLKWSLLSSRPLTKLLRWHLKSGVQGRIQDFKIRIFTCIPLYFFGFVHAGVIEQPGFETWAPKSERDSKKVVIKALVQKTTNKFLLCLAGVDFVDFLLKLLTIPIGSVLQLLGGNSGIGSIDNLYMSISKLSSECFVSQSSKELLINPKVALLDKRSYNSQSRYYKFVSFNEKSGTQGLLLMDLMRHKKNFKGPSKFMVTDDLIVTPSSTMSIISHLQSLKIAVSDVNELAINIGTKEALSILKASLTSNTAVLSNALQLMKQPKQEK